METNITINDTHEGNKTYTVLRGDAPKQEQMWKQYEVNNVSLNSIVSYILTRCKSESFSNAVVIVCYDAGIMRFNSDIHREGNVIINGVARPSVPYLNFKINSPDGKFNQNNFAQLLRRYGHYLTDEFVRTSLLKDCQNLRLKRSISTENSNDRKANFMQGYQQIVLEKPFSVEKFDVTMPLFEGVDIEETFSVEIFYEALNNNELSISLESASMYQLYEIKRKDLLDGCVSVIKANAPNITVLVAV